MVNLGTDQGAPLKGSIKAMWGVWGLGMSLGVYGGDGVQGILGGPWDLGIITLRIIGVTPISWQTLGTLNTRMRVLLKNVPIKVAKCCEMRCHGLVLSIPRA